MPINSRVVENLHEKIWNTTIKMSSCCDWSAALLSQLIISCVKLAYEAYFSACEYMNVTEKEASCIVFVVQMTSQKCENDT